MRLFRNQAVGARRMLESSQGGRDDKVSNGLQGRGALKELQTGRCIKGFRNGWRMGEPAYKRVLKGAEGC
jgi:hypothetical protein